MATRDQLVGTSRSDARRIKAAAHVAGGLLAGRRYVRGAYGITVLDGPRLVDLNGTPAVELSLRFTKAGKDVTPANFNPWYIVNPPLLVPDPAGDVALSDGDGNMRRYREDPAAALIEIVRDMARVVFGA